MVEVVAQHWVQISCDVSYHDEGGGVDFGDGDEQSLIRLHYRNESPIPDEIENGDENLTEEQMNGDLC